ncbi:MAG TPA: acyltransferase [Tepidisphaeraceae bacterium]|jgi:peptidoglycan/LPS O-acetylase OafA/YrhL|nr:acyltransferase [Tepidisphaeraceae bacterium]
MGNADLRGVGGYKPQLDGLRALAVGLVMIEHYFARAPVWFPFGAVGVYFFFVLSGYLITGILLRARDDGERSGESQWFTLRQFYARRFLRIFPIYYVVLALAAWSGVGAARRMLWWNAAYLCNVYVAMHGWQFAVSHFWTLAVEEQFYIFWPLLVVFLPKRLLLPAFWAAVAIPLVYKTAVFAVSGNLLASAVLTPGCLDTLGAGALLALYARSGRSKVPAALAWFGIALVTCGAVAYALDANNVAWSVMLGYGMASAGAWLVARAAAGFRGVVGRVLSFGPLVYLGTISYGVYIIHNFAPVIMGRFHLGGIRSLVSWLLFTLVAASVSYWTFERPINSLKRFFPYSASGGRGRAVRGPVVTLPVAPIAEQEAIS